MAETPQPKDRKISVSPPGEQASTTTPQKRRRPPPSPLAVITASLGLFLVILTLLAIQVRNGRDPALGPGPAIPALTQPAAGKGTGAQQQAAQIVTRTSPVPPP